MEDFINVIKNHSQVRTQLKNILDKHNKLSYSYQSKIGCDTLIQNVVLKTILNQMSIIVVDVDIELKIKISRKNI